VWQLPGVRVSLRYISLLMARTNVAHPYKPNQHLPAGNDLLWNVYATQKNICRPAKDTGRIFKDIGESVLRSCPMLLQASTRLSESLLSLALFGAGTGLSTYPAISLCLHIGISFLFLSIASLVTSASGLSPFAGSALIECNFCLMAAR